MCGLFCSRCTLVIQRSCLSRVVTLWNTPISFLGGKEMKSNFMNIKHDVFYLFDIFEKLNLLTFNKINIYVFVGHVFMFYIFILR